MKKDVITLVPVSSSPQWTAIDVSATALNGIDVGDPVSFNPVGQTGVNLATYGMITAYVSALNEITFGYRLLSQSVDLIVWTP